MGPDDNSKQWTEMGVLEKAKHLLFNITIEPVIALYVVLSNTIGIVSNNFKLEKSCLVNNHYPEQTCVDILAGVDKNETMVNNIQTTISQMGTWQDPIQSVLVFILLLFIGSWSDRNRRRKPCLLLPLSGEIASMIGLLVCTYYFLELPLEVNGLVQAVLPSVCGGILCLEIAVFSYIADITKEDERTFRISVISTLLTLVQPLGTYLSFVVYKQGKYFGTFGACGVLYFVAFLYGLLMLREPTEPKPLADNFCKDFFDYTHITDTVKTVFKKREGNDRRKILLVVLLSVLLTAPIFGEAKLGQFFLLKQVGWDIEKVSHYTTFYYLVTIVGSFIVLSVLGSNLKINDTVIGIIACCLKITVNILYTLSKDGRTFYILALFEVLSGVSVIIMRSITTKLVPPEELGKLYAFIGIAGAGSTIVVLSLYDTVYTLTLSVLPGAFFLIGVVFNILAVVTFVYISILQNRDMKPQTEQNASAIDNKGFEDIELNNEINTKL